ncbi:MAG: hypothetical protein LQ346_006220 [Caloplaca aetnensis]|nr:MAG: hypothetical protein LQ346_006220 [Caloplaca aetnensis]
MPQKFEASKEFANKKVVLFAVPVSFQQTDSQEQDHLSDIKSKGVDLVIVIAFNDAWVMSAWAKANGIKDEIASRYAMVIDHGKITYAEVETGGDVTVSGAEAVLKAL